MARPSAVALTLFLSGCALVQPHSKGNAPAVADTLTAILSGSAAAGLGAYANGNPLSSYSRSGAAVTSVLGLALVALGFTGSAIHGFTRHPSSETKKAKPIPVIEMLAAFGLEAAGSAAARAGMTGAVPGQEPECTSDADCGSLNHCAMPRCVPNDQR